MGARQGASGGGEGWLATYRPADILCLMTVLYACVLYMLQMSMMLPSFSRKWSLFTPFLQTFCERRLGPCSAVTACAARCAELVSTNTHVTVHESPFGGGGGSTKLTAFHVTTPTPAKPSGNCTLCGTAHIQV